MNVVRAITVISGGQTGADRAALDFAIERGLAHGGWCPRGRLAEDGPIPPQYELQETPSARYAQRTAWNVRDSDATVVFGVRPRLIGGTRLTLKLASRLGKPVLQLIRETISPDLTVIEERAAAASLAAAELREFLEAHQVRRLNVAGPRASQEPEIGEFVMSVLRIALAH